MSNNDGMGEGTGAGVNGNRWHDPVNISPTGTAIDAHL